MKTFHQFTIRVFQSWFEILNRLATSGDSLQEIYCDCRYITYIRRLSMYTLTQKKNARLWYYVYLHLFAFCLYCYLSLYFTFFGCCCCVQQLEDINRMNFMALGTITGPIFCCFYSVFFLLLYVSFFQTFRAPLFSSVVWLFISFSLFWLVLLFLLFSLLLSECIYIALTAFVIFHSFLLLLIPLLASSLTFNPPPSFYVLIIVINQRHHPEKKTTSKNKHLPWKNITTGRYEKGRKRFDPLHF